MEPFSTFFHSVSFTYLFLLGMYMLFSERNIFADTHPSPSLRRVTGVNLIAWSISFLLSVFLFKGHFETDEMTHDIVRQLSFFLLPLSTLLLMKLVQLPRIKWKKFLLPALPPAVLLVCFIATNNNIFYRISIAYWIIYTVTFLIVYINKVKRYTNRLKENYSDLENRELQWLGIITTIFVSYLIIYIIATLSEREFYLYVSYIMGLCAWSYIVWHIEHQEKLDDFWTDKSISDITDEPEQADKSVTTKLEWIGERLQTECIDRKLFLQPDLNIAYLAQVIGTNRTYLSQYLRQKDTNFYTFVNTLRIQHAQHLFESEPQMTLSDIAAESGFNSLQSYRRVYYSITGNTQLPKRG